MHFVHLADVCSMIELLDFEGFLLFGSPNSMSGIMTRSCWQNVRRDWE